MGVAVGAGVAVGVGVDVVVGVFVGVRVAVGVDVVVGVDFGPPITPQPVTATQMSASANDGMATRAAEGSLRTAPTRKVGAITSSLLDHGGSGGGAGMARTSA